MGLVYAEIELINGEDAQDVRKGRMDKDDLKRIVVTSLVDSGGYMSAINENIQQVLNIPVIGSRMLCLANGETVSCDIVSPIKIIFRNKEVITRAVVLPGNSEVLLGAITMEEMAVIIDPLRQELIIPEGEDALPFYRFTSFKPYRNRLRG